MNSMRGTFVSLCDRIRHIPSVEKGDFSVSAGRPFWCKVTVQLSLISMRTSNTCRFCAKELVLAASTRLAMNMLLMAGSTSRWLVRSSTKIPRHLNHPKDQCALDHQIRGSSCSTRCLFPPRRSWEALPKLFHSIQNFAYQIPHCFEGCCPDLGRLGRCHGDKHSSLKP